MEKIGRKILLFVLAMLLSSNTFCYTSIVNATDGDDEEVDYATFCSGDLTHASSEKKAACRQYQMELNERVGKYSDQLDDLEDQIKDLKKDIAKNVTKVTEYNNEIEKIEAEIAKLEASIAEIDGRISEMETEIIKRQNNIDSINKTVKNRMVALQSFMYINNFFDFLMGATSFIDLIRRVEALNDIQKFDNDLMDEMDSELKLLKEQKEEIERSREVLAENIANVEAEKSYVEGLKKASEELLNEYYSQESRLEEEAAELADNLDEISDTLHRVSESLNEIVASYGWTKPIENGRITASTWYYPNSFGGGIHLGIDIGASHGTTVKAVANGVVLYNSNGCDSYGYLGSTCGYPGSKGGGNQVCLLVRVDNKTFAVKYLHLKKGTAIPIGTIVQAGQKIGEVGSSGNSSGNHCHVEIIYLGTKSISYYAEHWNGDFSFGCNYDSKALQHTCSYDDGKIGGSAPCRLPPKTILGY